MRLTKNHLLGVRSWIGTPSKSMKPVPTTPTVAEDRDKMLDDELVLSAGDPDNYSEGSGNPDDDWDGNNVKTRLTVTLPFRLMIALSLATTRMTVGYY